jgi:hypothetical protein
MILEGVRMIADWLADGTQGVNALLPTTPRDAGDAQPANVTIIDQSRDDNVARNQAPAATALPAIAVEVDRVDELDGQVATITADGHLLVRVRYLTSNTASAAAMRDAMYVLRTVLRSLRQFFALSASDSRRVRNSVYLESCLDLATAPMWAPIEDAFVAGAVLATIQLRDLAP